MLLFYEAIVLIQLFVQLPEVRCSRIIWICFWPVIIALVNTKACINYVCYAMLFDCYTVGILAPEGGALEFFLGMFFDFNFNIFRWVYVSSLFEYFIFSTISRSDSICERIGLNAGRSLFKIILLYSLAAIAVSKILL